MNRLHHLLEKSGDLAVEAFHLIGLFVIGATVVWTAVHEYLVIMQKPYATLDDILLLFIYLELGAMVGIFFKTKRLPVIFLIFISITALTRYLAVDLKTMESDRAIVVVGAIFVLALAVLVLRYSETRFIEESGRSAPDKQRDPERDPERGAGSTEIL